MVRHYGVFKFKPEVTEDQVDECFSAMKGMVGRIPGLQEREHDPYQSEEGLKEGFTHGFIMTFDSLGSRDANLPHPARESGKDIVAPRLDQVIVFDFAV